MPFLNLWKLIGGVIKPIGGQSVEADITSSNVTITGGTISGVTISDNFTTTTDPALNAATATAVVDA
jgi:hypothetical protein